MVEKINKLFDEIIEQMEEDFETSEAINHMNNIRTEVLSIIENGD